MILQVVAKWSKVELFVVKWIPAGKQPADELFLLRLLSALQALKQRDGNNEMCGGYMWIYVARRDPNTLQKSSYLKVSCGRDDILSGSLA